MANYFRPLPPILSILLLIASCQEGGEAGSLFGQWRMAHSDTQYISFSGAVTKLNDLDHGTVYGNFQHRGDSLFIQCYSEKGAPQDTAIVEQSFGFRPINNIRLKVETLDGDRLVLTKDGQTWSFTKY